MAQSANERRAAQRQLARTIRANRAKAPDQRVHLIDISVRRAVFQARVNYANDVMSGRAPMPAPGSAEAKNLASLASYSAHGQADPRFEGAFNRYWYHFRNAQMTETEIDEEIPPEDDDEDSEAA